MSKRRHLSSALLRTTHRIVPGLLVVLCLITALPSFAASSTSPKLRVSDNGRFFVHENGQPFYWQGDTAWELFARLNREEAIHYLDDRARRGFNVTQAAAISCFTGSGKNAHGDRPCDGTVDKLLLTPGDDAQDAAQYDYCDHVVFTVTYKATQPDTKLTIPYANEGGGNLELECATLK